MVLCVKFIAQGWGGAPHLSEINLIQNTMWCFNYFIIVYYTSQFSQINKYFTDCVNMSFSEEPEEDFSVWLVELDEMLKDKAFQL